MQDNKSESYFEPPIPTEDQKGSLILAPNDAKVEAAAGSLARVPTTGTPLSVAKWMIKYRDQGRTMEWPPDSDRQRPANPIIVAFFAATKTKPTEVTRPLGARLS